MRGDILYYTSTEFVSVPCLDWLNFSKTSRQILKVKQDSGRAIFTLSDKKFILNFCQFLWILTQKSSQSAVRLRNGVKFGGSTVKTHIIS